VLEGDGLARTDGFLQEPPEILGKRWQYSPDVFANQVLWTTAQASCRIVIHIMQPPATVENDEAVFRMLGETPDTFESTLYFYFVTFPQRSKPVKRGSEKV
jgi:hypothetical protein